MSSQTLPSEMSSGRNKDTGADCYFTPSAYLLVGTAIALLVAALHRWGARRSKTEPEILGSMAPQCCCTHWNYACWNYAYCWLRMPCDNRELLLLWARLCRGVPTRCIVFCESLARRWAVSSASSSALCCCSASSIVSPRLFPNAPPALAGGCCCGTSPRANAS